MRPGFVLPLERELLGMVRRTMIAFGVALVLSAAMLATGGLAQTTPAVQATAIALTGCLLGGFVATGWLSRAIGSTWPWGLAAVLAMAALWRALDAPGRVIGQDAGAPASGLGVGVPGLLLAGGVGTALVLAWVAHRALRGALERETRFRALLSIGADFYWEVGGDLRVSVLASAATDWKPVNERRVLGRMPWQAGLEASAEAWTVLKNTLDAQRPFRDFIVSYRLEPRGPLEHFAISGEPRSVAGRFGGYWGVARRVTEDVEGRRALSSAKRQAEQASRAKTAFLANTSHEMRTPLHGVLGLARLAREAGDEVSRRHYLDSLLESAQALSSTISDVLDVSRIEAGRFALHTGTFDLVDAVTLVQGQFEESARAKGLRLTVHIDPALPRRVEGDSLRVRQVLEALVGNAVKFTAQGMIRLLVEPAGPDRIRFVVSDTGPGIDARSLERLFEPFTQADESDTRRAGGLGLGLWIARQLTERMNGEIRALSTPGMGSSFRVELPLPACAVAPAQAPASADEPVPASLPGLRVLLVEDNPLNRLLAGTMLRQSGVLVDEVADGEAAIHAVENARVPYDLVLMDLHMPGISGYEATRRLRSRHDREQLPIVALTAAALDAERDQAFAVGMNDFLAKPVDARELTGAVARHARRAERVRTPAGT